MSKEITATVEVEGFRPFPHFQEYLQRRAAAITKSVCCLDYLRSLIDEAIAEARAEEREACAKIAEETGENLTVGDESSTPFTACNEIAAAIRARGENP